MDLTWLASSVKAVAMAAIICLVWSTLQELGKSRQIKALGRVEAAAGDVAEKPCKFFSELLAHPTRPRVFIGS